jgi:hypothetical protein
MDADIKKKIIIFVAVKTIFLCAVGGIIYYYV